MITLFGFAPAFGLPSASPFVIKTDVQLKMSGLPYAYGEGGIPQNGPKGKIPWIEDDGQRIGDSTFIRDYLEKKYGVDLDAGLTQEQRARTWCVERMLEDHLYWALVRERWLDDANFAKGPSTFFDRVPEAIRDTMRRDTRERVKNNVFAQGLGRHAPEEIADLGARSIASLAVQIGDKPYLMGDKPCGADATAFAMTVSALTPFFNGPLRDAACLYPNLLSYTGRMMQHYYSEIAAKAA